MKYITTYVKSVYDSKIAFASEKYNLDKLLWYPFFNNDNI